MHLRRYPEWAGESQFQKKQFQERRYGNQVPFSLLQTPRGREGGGRVIVWLNLQHTASIEWEAVESQAAFNSPVMQAPLLKYR